MTTRQSIKLRKSPEKFLDAPLDKKVLETIVEMGNYAPIFGKIHFTVVTDRKLLDTVNEITIEKMKHSGNEFAEKMANLPGYNPVRNAPAAVILSALDQTGSENFNMANVSCAAENMILAATELGIGSRFVMGPVMSLTQEPLKTQLHLPDGYTPLVMVLLGNTEDPWEERRKESTNIAFLS